MGNVLQAMIIAVVAGVLGGFLGNQLSLNQTNKVRQDINATILAAVRERDERINDIQEDFSLRLGRVAGELAGESSEIEQVERAIDRFSLRLNTLLEGELDLASRVGVIEGHLGFAQAGKRDISQNPVPDGAASPPNGGPRGSEGGP